MFRGVSILGLLMGVVVLASSVDVANADGGVREKKAPARIEPRTFKLDFSGTPPSTNSPAPPPGAATLRRDADGAMPFLGLKLSRPLGD